MRTAVQETSIDAFYAIVNGRGKTQQERIYEIVRSACLAMPSSNLSLNEIKRLYVGVHGDIELSTVSARVNSLVCANRLQRLESIRSCSVTGKGIHPVRLPLADQGALF